MLRPYWVHALGGLLVVGLGTACQRSPVPQVGETLPVETAPAVQLAAQPAQPPQPIPKSIPSRPITRPEPPAAVKDVVQRYLAAMQKQDIAAMGELAEVPFVDLERRFIPERSALPSVLKQLVEQWPKQDAMPDISYSVYREADEWHVPDEVAQQLFADALNDNDWAVTLWFDPLQQFTILVRVTGEQAAIVAGPLKPNQIGKTPTIPEPANSSLTSADSMVLYSLNPDFRAKGSKDKPQFHGWEVLGQTEIRDAATREKMTAALRQATANNPGVAAGCFNPRHGLRLVQGDKTIDLVICFECFQVQIFVGEEAVGGFLTTFHPRAAFDAPLTAAGIRIAPDTPAAEPQPPEGLLEGRTDPAPPPPVPAVDPFG